MLKFAVALAVAAPVMLVAPAYAADIATIGCVENTVDAATRAQLNKDLEKNLADAGGPQTYSQSTIEGMRKASLACQAKHGWSDAATMGALLYTVPKLGWPVADRMGRAAKIDPKKVEARFMALPQAVRATAMDNPSTFEKIATDAINAGEINGDNATLAGGLLGLLAVREKGLADFQAN
ncbi:hypothetical protein P1X14_02050 [Sphingomonas sp. AOB5]|uniref:hypothetical protein n=1 Tax=Sphingomonas sp. AOB5 TaxID=3034017 RepID=UPI0023F8773B|nr:hypothetical protein [Sphingomonas sp. AOB5]MDF7774016.1 hypothetical protein [Sphingomonas sp. AOB5]